MFLPNLRFFKFEKLYLIVKCLSQWHIKCSQVFFAVHGAMRSPESGGAKRVSRHKRKSLDVMKSFAKKKNPWLLIWTERELTFSLVDVPLLTGMKSWIVVGTLPKLAETFSMLSCAQKQTRTKSSICNATNIFQLLPCPIGQKIVLLDSCGRLAISRQWLGLFQRQPHNWTFYSVIS